jgi:hypothetical protein
MHRQNAEVYNIKVGAAGRKRRDLKDRAFLE